MFIFAYCTSIESLISTLSASDVYKKWQKLGKQRDQEAWEMYPSMVNAYFNPPSNEVGSLVVHMISSNNISIDCLPCRNPSRPVLLSELVSNVAGLPLSITNTMLTGLDTCLMAHLARLLPTNLR